MVKLLQWNNIPVVVKLLKNDYLPVVVKLLKHIKERMSSTSASASRTSNALAPSDGDIIKHSKDTDSSRDGLNNVVIPSTIYKTVTVNAMVTYFPLVVYQILNWCHLLNQYIYIES